MHACIYVNVYIYIYIVIYISYLQVQPLCLYLQILYMFLISFFIDIYLSIPTFSDECHVKIMASVAPIVVAQAPTIHSGTQSVPSSLWVSPDPNQWRKWIKMVWMGHDLCDNQHSKAWCFSHDGAETWVLLNNKMDEVFQSSQPRLGFHQQTLIIYAVVLFLPLSPKSGGKPQTHCPVLCLRVKSLSSPPLGDSISRLNGLPILDRIYCETDDYGFLLRNYKYNIIYICV